MSQNIGSAPQPPPEHYEEVSRWSSDSTTTSESSSGEPSGVELSGAEVSEPEINEPEIASPTPRRAVRFLKNNNNKPPSRARSYSPIRSARANSDVFDRTTTTTTKISDHPLPSFNPTSQNTMATPQLPTGAPLQNFVPRFNSANYGPLNPQSNESFNSVESGESQESFRTQVPMPYYLPNEYENIQPRPEPAPYATPEFLSQQRAQFAPFQNPNVPYNNAIHQGQGGGGMGMMQNYLQQQQPPPPHNYPQGNMAMGMGAPFNGINSAFQQHHSNQFGGQIDGQIGGASLPYQNHHQMNMPPQNAFHDQVPQYQGFQPGLQTHQLYNGGNFRGPSPRAMMMGNPPNNNPNGGYRPQMYSQAPRTTQLGKPVAKSSPAPRPQTVNNSSDEASLDQTPLGSKHRPSMSSEPRPTLTPMLRSRRGQTVASASVDRLQSVQDWVENTPTRAGRSSSGDGTKGDAKSPPPKMLAQIAEGESSMGGGAGIHTKAIITQASSGAAMAGTSASRALTLANNPFSPVNTLAPYTGPRFAASGGGMSPLLRTLTRGGTYTPSADEALDIHYLPFTEYCRQAKSAQWGVIKIKNIPYGVTRQEILAFLGRNARIVSENDYEAVHIIMERVTSKTLDAYIEFISFTEAANAVQRFEHNRLGGRGGRLGQRHVEVELSSQEVLMKELFPKAKNVRWHGSRPEIIPTDLNDPYNSGFQGFVSREEMVMLVKHVESPQRSPFSKDCPQRPFECLVSTLQKFPWYMVDYVTCGDRQMLYKATIQLLELLVERVTNEDDMINLNQMLLKRVWRTALRCDGFSPTMKDNIVFKLNIDPQVALELGVPPKADLWGKIWTIGPRKDVAYDLVDYYIKIIADATADRKQLTLAEKAAIQATATPTIPSIFGNLHKLVDYDGCMAKTMGELATMEWNAIEKVLRQALTPALEAGPSA